MKNIDISVVVPVYGVEKYLQDCIDSLVAQTKENIELIFVNDASPDRCIDILRANEKKYPDLIKVIDSPENLRQGGARNLGIKKAQGKYIGFVDSDDWVSPNMYQVLWDAVIKEDADVAFINCARVKDKNDENYDKPMIIYPQYTLDWNNRKLTDEGRCALMCSPLGGACFGLWKKSIIVENSVFFPEKLAYEDNYWGTLIRCYLNKVVIMPSEICYFYRFNPTSTGNKKEQNYHYDRLLVEDMLLKEIKERGLFERFYAGIEYTYIKRRVLISFNIFSCKYAKINKKSIRELFKSLKKEFPAWSKNAYYIKRHTIVERAKYKIIYHFPVAMARYYRLKQRFINRRKID